jgi:heat shock protein HslJ
MTQEGAYLAMLDSVASYKIDGEHLVLYDADKAELATYEVVDQSLAGTSWQVISYNTGTEAVRSVVLDTEITASFVQDGAPSDGQVTGNASCNDYFGPYETEGDTISIGPLGATEMMCAEPDGVMEQESAYLTALRTVATYRIEGQHMRTLTAEGATAVTFNRSPGQ